MSALSSSRSATWLIFTFICFITVIPSVKSNSNNNNVNGDALDDVPDLSNLNLEFTVPSHATQETDADVEAVEDDGDEDDGIIGDDRRFLKKAKCNKSCDQSKIGDGVCDVFCHNKNCKNDGGDCDGFDMIVATAGTIKPDLQSAITNATSRWRRTIKDLKGAYYIKAGFSCNGLKLNTNVVFDDMLLLFAVIPIDGKNNTLAYATPCAYSKGKKPFPVVHMIAFDVDDYDQIAAGGNLETVILHELGHAVGIGTYWEGMRDLLQKGSSPLMYKGKGGIKGLEMIGGSGMPIVEEDGGSGTARSHWDEDTYDDELMTGYLRGVKGKLSKMTIESLTDIGYQVDSSGADAYTIPSSARKSENGDKGLQLKGCVRKGKLSSDKVYKIPTN